MSLLVVVAIALCGEMVILGLVTSIIRSTSRLIIASQQVSAGSNHTTVVTMTTRGTRGHCAISSLDIGVTVRIGRFDYIFSF